MGRQVEHVHRDDRQHDGDEDRRDLRHDAFQDQDECECAHADGQRCGNGLAGDETVEEPLQLGDEPIGVHGEPEQLGELTDQDRQCEAVHVADLRGLRQEIGDEAQMCQAGQQHDGAHEEREHRGQHDGFRWIPVRPDEGKDRRGDHGAERRVGAEDQVPRWPHQRIGGQAQDGRVEARDRGQAGELRVGHALWHEQSCQHEPGHDIFRQPRPLVGAQHPDPRNRCELHLLPIRAVRHRTASRPTGSKDETSARRPTRSAIGGSGLRLATH